MNLATRCASCGTVFRVAHEQLRVSEGWVRCGRCDAVFDADEVLFDIDNGTPVHLELGPALEPALDAAPDPALESAPGSAPDPADGGFAAPDQPVGHSGTEPSLSDWPALPAASPGPAWSPVTPGQAVEPHFAQHEEFLLRTPSAEAEPWLDDAPDTGEDSRPVLAPLAPTHTPVRSPTGAAAGSLSAAASQASGLGAPLPSFLRSAEHGAVWHRPAVRSALAAASALLALSLLLQTALLWRDSLAAHWPATAPALQGLCSVVGCQVLPLRRIESLAVESSGLNRLDGSTLYRLQLVLRNRAATAVMAPALDLSLTDAQGKPVARRVLSMSELGVPQSALQPGQELPIKVLMATGGRRVDGYTVDLFYP